MARPPTNWSSKTESFWRISGAKPRAVCLAQPNGLGEWYKDLKRGNAPDIYKEAILWGKW